MEHAAAKMGPSSPEVMKIPETADGKDIKYWHIKLTTSRVFSHEKEAKRTKLYKREDRGIILFLPPLGDSSCAIRNRDDNGTYPFQSNYKTSIQKLYKLWMSTYFLWCGSFPKKPLRQLGENKLSMY